MFPLIAQFYLALLRVLHVASLKTHENEESSKIHQSFENLDLMDPHPLYHLFFIGKRNNIVMKVYGESKLLRFFLHYFRMNGSWIHAYSPQHDILCLWVWYNFQSTPFWKAFPTSHYFHWKISSKCAKLR